MTMKSAISVLAALLILSLFSSTASAQSTISGIAKDSSGAVMAGVKVEAASEALIERSRTVTTNGEGRYAIVDLRPGSYTVTFTIEGFNTVKQQVEVPANVTVPVDADMKPGSVGQTVEVQALVATVDVENVAHPEVLTRNDIDSVPTARNLQSVGSIARLPLYRPLVGDDKLEIQEVARRIGTYDISAEPFHDCCPVFQSKSPALFATSDALDAAEADLDIASLVDRGIRSMAVERYRYTQGKAERLAARHTTTA